MKWRQAYNAQPARACLCLTAYRQDSDRSVSKNSKRSGLWRLFERCQACFEFGQFGASTLEDLRLDIELLARDQIKPLEHRTQHCPHISFHIAGRRLCEQLAHLG